ncbi:MAG: hypothetical protein U5K31_02785 [Balneolaceae bacterium]|nr:hypothetical protein [Balneolaceae bacterium]
MRKSFQACLLSLFLCLPLCAAAQNFGVGFRGGTTGLGADVIGSINESLNVRLGGSYFPYSHDMIIEDADVDVRYEGEVKLMSLSAILDWYPSQSAFHLSGGIISQWYAGHRYRSAH